MLIDDIVYHFAEKWFLWWTFHIFFFFIMARSSPSHSYKRPNQSLASIHWLTYKSAVVVAVVFISSVVGVCMVFYHTANMCGRQHVWLLVCVMCQHAWNGVYIEKWAAAASRLTLAYSLPTVCPNKALNRLEQLQTPEGVSTWKKISHN